MSEIPNVTEANAAGSAKVAFLNIEKNVTADIEVATLTFEKPDYETFACLNLCRTAFEKGGLYPAAVNAANEKANELFRKGKIAFLDIPKAVEAAFDNVHNVADYSLSQVFETDRAIREATERLFI